MITYQTRYGISLAQFENLKNLQGNKCAICKLGKVKDSIKILETMIQYLKKHRSNYENTVD